MFYFHFANNQPTSEGSLSSPSVSTNSHHPKVGVIVGSVVAVVVAISLAVAAFLWFRRRKQPAKLDISLPVREEFGYNGDKGLLTISRESDVLMPHPYTEFYETPRTGVSLIPNTYTPLTLSFSDPDATIAISPPQSASGSYSLRRGSEAQTPLGTTFLPQHPHPPPQPPIDIDTIMTMLAQRIDAPADPEAPLPMYRG